VVAVRGVVGVVEGVVEGVEEGEVVMEMALRRGRLCSDCSTKVRGRTRAGSFSRVTTEK
jgi:hypothetical protein